MNKKRDLTEKSLPVTASCGISYWRRLTLIGEVNVSTEHCDTFQTNKSGEN